ncbi:unnamed protein product [Microthlaspi erraticum]|uniref:Integrase catalytic domain-containing protein n=1 Tax=Microthlaspi erraticum TaxID=1685480 RepID=A0A6D2IW62_9BRAS|nr:unnamed protein product [Microthlaspi erraticum]
MGSTQTSSNDTVIVFTTPSLHNVNMTNVTKLTASNFLMWSRQVHALLDGYDLAGYVDGSMEIPPSTLTANDVTTVNPAYTLWKRQDKLIYSALLGAIMVSIQPILSTTTTSAQIWDTLSATYAKPSRGHVKQLKQQVKQWTKGKMSIDAYVQGFTTRFDQLALLGKAIDREDQIEYVLEGLPEEYKQVVDQIEGREVTPSLTEVHEKLINFEVKLQSKTPPAANLPITANAVDFRGPNNNNSHGNRSNPRNNYQGQQRNNNNNRNSQTWQQQQFSNRSDQNTQRGYQGRCQICGVHGHSARRCPQLPLPGSYNNNSRPVSMPTSSWQPRANMAVAQPYNPNNWVIDSGATHHLTTDLNNLALHQPYTGGEEVTIADGSALSISHTDVWTSPVLSVDNFKYYLIFVDHFTRYTWFYPLRFKSQVKETFVAFKALVEKRFQCTICNLYSDNGGEFIALRSFLTSHGASHLTSLPHTPEHNGVAERKHRHIVETGLTLLHQASIPTTYWTYAFSTAVYLINRLPTPVIAHQSPYEKLFQQSPNYTKLRVFGSLCFPWLRPYTTNKLESRSSPCTFLGYSLSQSAYLCLDASTGRIYTSRHVQFVESEFPLSLT